jgi:hypothetical protein
MRGRIASAAAHRYRKLRCVWLAGACAWLSRMIKATNAGEFRMCGALSMRPTLLNQSAAAFHEGCWHASRSFKNTILFRAHGSCSAPPPRWHAGVRETGRSSSKPCGPRAASHAAIRVVSMASARVCAGRMMVRRWASLDVPAPFRSCSEDHSAIRSSHSWRGTRAWQPCAQGGYTKALMFAAKGPA